MKTIYRTYSFGDMLVIYLLDDTTNLFGMTMIPRELEDDVTLEGNWEVESLVQLKIVGDNYPDGFSHGHTLRNSQSTTDLKFVNQKEDEIGEEKIVVTTLESEKVKAIHCLSYRPKESYLCSETEIINKCSKEIAIEMVSSYSICGFSSLNNTERMKDFKLHRLRSKWSAEGRLVTDSLLELQLEPSWQRYGVQSIRYGEIGSMPVRMYFPWMILEDTKFGYGIGCQLYHPASWQMEVYNRDERISFSGGLADREFGHWYKKLVPGGVFIAPKAVLTVSAGDVDKISWYLTKAQEYSPVFQKENKLENELPVIFNEFCTTWGSPSIENIKKILNIMKGRGIKYFVIDSGWYAKAINDWQGNLGDWEINNTLFPGGFTEAVKIIKDAGMIPGLWFEIECIGKDARVYQKEDMLLKRDGYTITTGTRRFWDMRNPEVIEYLTEKIIGILKTYGFGYLKIDYNDNIGIGCDGADSLGEGLRQNMMAYQDFVQKIRREIPELVIENCSSGGHRLEPSMMGLTDMASFSDAHECREIPIIAANVHRAILPRQSQIWAVFRKEDDSKRIFYSITNTFLGRMCLSGDVYDLNEKQWNIIDKGIRFYKKIVPIIAKGRTLRFGNNIKSYNHPEGWQGIVRIGENQQILAVIHTFSNHTGSIEIPINKQFESSSLKIEDIYSRQNVLVKLENETLIIDGMDEYEGAGILITCIN